MKIKIGTKSVLWGVHAFWWHGFSVLLAWRRLYREWPRWDELIAIMLHDAPGYVGCPNIDGPEGKGHPEKGARLAARIVGRIKSWTGRGDGVCLGRNPFDIGTYFLTLLHSRDVAKARGMEVSKLSAPDKYSIVFDPKWFYILRARLSGELAEYKRNAIVSGHLLEGDTDGQWYDSYRAHVLARPDIQELLKD